MRDLTVFSGILMIAATSLRYARWAGKLEVYHARLKAKYDGMNVKTMSQAIQRYALDLARLHTDATSLKLYGAYERDDDAEGPLVTFG